MNQQKGEIIKEYKKNDTVDTFDEGRRKYAFQKYKNKFEADIVKQAIKNSKEGSMVLDVACGTGRMVETVLNTKKNINYFGLDTSKEMMSKIENKSVIKCIGDAENIPFKDNSFDVVFTFHLLFHLPQKNQEKVIREMMRVTKEGGTVIFDVLNEDFIWERIKKHFGKEKTEGIYKFKVNEVKDIVKGKRFKIEKLCDAPIKNKVFYAIFNTLNEWRAWFSLKYFHMLYFVVKQ